VAEQEKDSHEGASHSAALPKVSDFLLKCFSFKVELRFLFKVWLGVEKVQDNDPVVAEQEEDGHEGASHSAALPKVSDFLLKCFRISIQQAFLNNLC
jgi:hypothetical protein